MTIDLSYIEEQANDFTVDLIEEDDVLALVALARAAIESVDIGDERNRCRICWVAWGAHEEDCPVLPFVADP